MKINAYKPILIAFLVGLIVGLILGFFISTSFMERKVSIPSAKETLKTSDNLRIALERFEKRKLIFLAEITSAVDFASIELSNEDSDFLDSKDNLEKKFKKVLKALRDLEKDLLNIEEKSETFFIALEKVTRSLRDADLRRAEELKNKEQKEKFTDRYLETTGSIIKTRRVLDVEEDYSANSITSSDRSYELSRMTDVELKEELKQEITRKMRALNEVALLVEKDTMLVNY